MSKRKNQSQEPSRPKSEAANSTVGLLPIGALHVYAPSQTGPQAERAGNEAPAASVGGGDVVAGFAGPKAVAARDRCTLYLSRELNAQLDLVAHIERKERSEIVESLLRAHLPKYRVERA